MRNRQDNSCVRVAASKALVFGLAFVANFHKGPDFP